MKNVLFTILVMALGTIKSQINIDIQQDSNFVLDPGSVPQENTATETINLIDIDGSGGFTVENARVGDTLSYIITIEWVDPKVPVMVTAPDSLFFEGFKKLSVKTKTKKYSEIIDGNPVFKSKSTFIYHLKASTIGTGKASSTEVPYLSALSQEKEYVPITTSLITISKAKIPFHKQSAFKWVLIVLGFVILTAGGWFLWESLKKRPKKISEPKVDLETKVLEIKNRISTAPSKELLMQMEGIAVNYLQEKLKNTSNNFDELLNNHISKGGSQAEEWQKLSQDFNFAKFGGGQKETHEVQEIYKRFTLCIKE